MEVFLMPAENAVLLNVSMVTHNTQDICITSTGRIEYSFQWIHSQHIGAEWLFHAAACGRLHVEPRPESIIANEDLPVTLFQTNQSPLEIIVRQLIHSRPRVRERRTMMSSPMSGCCIAYQSGDTDMVTQEAGPHDEGKIRGWFFSVFYNKDG